MSGRKSILGPPTEPWSKEGMQLQLAEQERDSMLQTAVQARKAFSQFRAILEGLGVEKETLDEAVRLLADKLAAEDS